jgi:hypothetical protein
MQNLQHAPQPCHVQHPIHFPTSDACNEGQSDTTSGPGPVYPNNTAETVPWTEAQTLEC